MKHVLFLNKVPVYVTDDSPYTGTPKLKEFVVQGKSGLEKIEYNSAKNAERLDSWEQACEVAILASKQFGETYLACDNGAGTSHRYGIVRAPKVGDEVSYGFNGDYYPCGKVVRVTPGYRVYTQDGEQPERMFNRKGKRAGWVMKGGTWSLVRGHHNEKNPHF